MIAADVRTEVSRLLAELIRIDTTNPPGNETAAGIVGADDDCVSHHILGCDRRQAHL